MGLLLLIKLFMTLYTFFKTLFFIKPKDLQQRYGKDSWVFIFGGSSGIGWELCLIFLHKGFNTIIVSNEKDKL